MTARERHFKERSDKSYVGFFLDSRHLMDKMTSIKVALVSNNVQTFSVFSYHNGPPTWPEDNAGEAPFVGVLAHEG